MPGKGIKDKAAIVGMACTRFGEHWNRGAGDLLVEAALGACASAGVEREQVDAYWLGTLAGGLSGLMLAEPLKIRYKPVTRVENFCATGSEALRNAAYAAACGAYDLVMAVGVEKLKDSGYSGLAASGAPPSDGTESTISAPAAFSLLAPAYAQKYGLDERTLRQVLTHIACKNHRNGARNPKAQFQKEISRETVEGSPKVAGMLGVFDCSGVSAPRRPSSAAPRTRTNTPTGRFSSRGCRLSPAPPKAPSARITTIRPSPKPRPPPRTPTRRRACATRARKSRRPKSTTASRRRNWC